MTVLLENAMKLLLAIAVGGLIGAEREFRHRAAGFRTIIFICLGSTLFTIFSLELGGDTSPVRIAAHLVTGVGFLCAGVVLEDRGKIVGLTTASTIWLTAALGMGIGGGQYILSILAIIAILVVLWVFPQFEARIYSAQKLRTYEVVCKIEAEKLEQLKAMTRQCGLSVQKCKRFKSGDDMVCVWEAYGTSENHEQLIEKLFADAEVKELKF